MANVGYLFLASMPPLIVMNRLLGSRILQVRERKQNPLSFLPFQNLSRLYSRLRFSLCLAQATRRLGASERGRSQKTTSVPVLPPPSRLNGCFRFSMSSFESQPLERFRSRQKSKNRLLAVLFQRFSWLNGFLSFSFCLASEPTRSSRFRSLKKPKYGFFHRPSSACRS